MLTICICDDQPHFAIKIEQRIKEICALQIPDYLDYQILPSFSSAKEVLHFLNHHTIDLLFLDIEMPGIDGFTLAEQLKEQCHNLLVIFVSSHDELVYDAFFYSPVYFLRKSEMDQQLSRIMQKVICRYLSDTGTMPFQTKDGEVILQIKDILYLEADHNYYNIYCADGMTYRSRGTLIAMENIMQKHHFSRVQSAYLINIAHIKQHPTANVILMSNDKKILISRRRADTFKEDYSTFIRRRTIV